MKQTAFRLAYIMSLTLEAWSLALRPWAGIRQSEVSAELHDSKDYKYIFCRQTKTPVPVFGTHNPFTMNGS
jgi:predicted transcriptional regulator